MWKITREERVSSPNNMHRNIKQRRQTSRADYLAPFSPARAPFREKKKHRYQRVAHQTLFERGRLAAKARMEKELDELEADISKLTKGPVSIAP